MIGSSRPFAFTACGVACLIATATLAQPRPGDESASSSLMANAPAAIPTNEQPNPHALRTVSLFAVAPPEPRTYKAHDLVQIIVRETSTAKSSAELDTKKESEINGAVPSWPDFNIQDLLQLTLKQGNDSDNPKLKVNFSKDFQGEGDYSRKDDFSARLTAEVIEVLPNGNLVLEARTHIKTDDEQATMKVTGICRPEDITPANTVLSNQIHDLAIDKLHKGELRDSSKKGIIAKVIETVFAF